MAEAHLGSGAEVTMVTTEVAPDDAARYGIVQVDGERVTDYAYKPDEPATTTATNEVFVFTPAPTLDRLEALAADAGEDGLDDLGSQLLPDQTRDGLARAHRLEGYWRDVGTIPAYWEAHRDFLSSEPPIDLDDPAWPVHTRGGRHSAARILRRRGGRRQPDLGGHPDRRGGARLGAVARASSSRRARRSWTRSCCPACGCASGAVVTRAVLDDRVEVGEGASVGGDGDITLVGRRARVARDSEVPAGARLPDPDQEDG